MNINPSLQATQEVFSSPSLGHNGGPTLSVPASEMVLPDDHKKLFHFAKWHIDDYIAGTMGMSPEQEGIYIRFLMRLYQRGKPLPDDDRFMALIMNLSTRVWRRVCDSLIAIGKILRKNGALTNSRFEREREKRAAELQKQADSAKARWDRERHLAKVSAELQANLAETSAKILESEAKKVNKINEAPVTTHMPLKSPETRDLDRKKDNQPPPQPASVVAGEVSGLNGATSLIIEKLSGWINPMMPDKRTARASVENFVSLYSGPVLRDAFGELEAKMLHGDIVARPIPYLASACKRLAAQPKSKPAWRKPMSRSEMIEAGIKPDDMPDVVWSKLQADIARAKSC